MEEVQQSIAGIVTGTIERVQSETAPLRRMWGEGEYAFPTQTLDDGATPGMETES